MPRILAAGLMALFVCTAPVHAQITGSTPPKGVEDLKAASEMRIEITRIALQLTPAQEKLWGPLEQAIRARAAARQQRLTRLAARLNDDKEPNPIEVLCERADGLSQRGATLKQLVDAWQPLYETLDTRQKIRVRFLVMYSLREVRDFVSSKLEEMDESEEW